MEFVFDFTSEIPLYMQIRNQVVIAIANMKLRNNDKLPTVRALSEESGINAMTISKAYQLLKTEGYIQTDRRSGATVTHKDEQKSVSQQTLDQLKLCISELVLAGWTAQEIIKLCENYV